MTRTVIAFLLDRTGSMAGCKTATIEAFNGYLSGLKSGDQKEVDLLEFTFLQFDSQSLDKICVAEDVRKVPELNDRNYEPRASTPLIDAAWKTIKAVEGALTKREDHPKVVVCIQTDGHENCSTEHTFADLNILIKEKIEAGWQFNFMGAGIDAYHQATMMGIGAAAAMSYDKSSPAATRSAFASHADVTREFSSGRLGSTRFSMAARASAGDEHARKYLNQDGTAKGPPDLTVAAPTPPAPKPGGTSPTARKPIVDDVTL
jgi:hypothetical protein